MTIFKEYLNLKTIERFEIIDITAKVNNIIFNSNLKEGIANVFVKHSTSAIVINENEPYLLKDIENILKTIILDKNDYNHDNIDNNADSHLRALILGSSESVPFNNGKLDLGTWQSLFFIDLDGSRNRTISITLIGE
jgi:secondary thiamine-phosphate synthase enzyme